MMICPGKRVVGGAGTVVAPGTVDGTVVTGTVVAGTVDAGTVVTGTDVAGTVVDGAELVGSVLVGAELDAGTVEVVDSTTGGAVVVVVASVCAYATEAPRGCATTKPPKETPRIARASPRRRSE
jgi:hypothetical protein